MIPDDCFFRIAHEVAKNGTCSRLQVGALIVVENRIVSVGYNGVASGLPHCNHYDNKPCHKSVHAEANAVIFAAKHGISTDGGILYCTHAPCGACAGLLINAGITAVKYYSPYRSEAGLWSLTEAGVKVERFTENGPVVWRKAG